MKVFYKKRRLFVGRVANQGINLDAIILLPVHRVKLIPRLHLHNLSVLDLVAILHSIWTAHLDDNRFSD
jgi:hypothetical protein